MSLNKSKKIPINISDPMRRNVRAACKMMVNQKLDSGLFGNISIRIGNKNEFWVNPAGISFDRLEIDDMVRMDIHGKVLEGKNEPHPGAIIHQEIYRLRLDVNAIVHTHSDNTVLMSLLGCPIQPFTQLGAAIHNDQAIYDAFTGPVRALIEGTAIAQALGQKSIVIAKNHGIFTAGPTIQFAVWDFIIADMAAKIHLAAKQLGLNQADKLSDEYLQKSKTEVRDKHCNLIWHSYLGNANQDDMPA